MTTSAVDKGADAATNDVPATAVNNNAAADTKAAADKAAVDAASVSAAEGRRLYIGNLAYACTDVELKEFFKGYLIESVSIPKNPRTEKAVGYAFVDLSTPTEADRAIADLSGKEILERKVSVQLAHKPETAADKAEGAGGDTRRRSSGRRRSGRGRSGRERKDTQATGVEGADAPADSDEVQDDQAQPLADITNKNAANKDPKTPKAPRPARERGPPADGVASKTKVMVANLPYDLTEEKLKELFAAYDPSSAKIALRPIPRFMIKKLQARNEARKGRGFGFVTLASEELQQKAVAEMNGKEIEGREIAVKVAIDSPDKTDEALAAKEEAKANGTDAAAADAVATETPAAPEAAAKTTETAEASIITTA